MTASMTTVEYEAKPSLLVSLLNTALSVIKTRRVDELVVSSYLILLLTKLSLSFVYMPCATFLAGDVAAILLGRVQATFNPVPRSISAE